jgi:hypothetical protein
LKSPDKTVGHHPTGEPMSANSVVLQSILTPMFEKSLSNAVGDDEEGNQKQLTKMLASAIAEKVVEQSVQPKGNPMNFSNI